MVQKSNRKRRDRGGVVGQIQTMEIRESRRVERKATSMETGQEFAKKEVVAETERT